MTWDRVVQRHAGVGVRQRAVPDDPVCTELYVLTLCVNLDTFSYGQSVQYSNHPGSFCGFHDPPLISMNKIQVKNFWKTVLYCSKLSEMIHNYKLRVRSFSRLVKLVDCSDAADRFT